MKLIEFLIDPMPAPRQNRADRWKVGDNARPIVKKYQAYRDKLLGQAIEQHFICPVYSFSIIFFIPFPKSYSKKKMEEMNEQYHTLKPDLDNLLKAFFDSIFRKNDKYFQGNYHWLKQRDKKLWDGFNRDDSVVCSYFVEKKWSYAGKIEVWDL